GAVIDSVDGERPPLRISGGLRLHAIAYEPPVASAQVKSAVLLAGLYADGQTSVREPRPTRDYTERMLAAFGWPVEASAGAVRLSGGHRLREREIDVPGVCLSCAVILLSVILVP